eukprot:1690705-Alexandrium_andersonii.AAC.1
MPDSAGVRLWFLLLVGDATDYATLSLARGHEAVQRWEAYDDGWLRWAGRPGRFATDSERGFVSRAG